MGLSAAAVVSVLFSEPKIPQSSSGLLATVVVNAVSVLFSEPKIPQCIDAVQNSELEKGFSALQRAENSSILCSVRSPSLYARFQCSSASRKFLKLVIVDEAAFVKSFSALQRAENSSMSPSPVNTLVHAVFQCSSASRKFLKFRRLQAVRVAVLRFSALQRAENSSMSHLFKRRNALPTFQCSSASRKFLNPTLAPASIHISDRDDHASSFLSLPGASP